MGEETDEFGSNSDETASEHSVLDVSCELKLATRERRARERVEARLAELAGKASMNDDERPKVRPAELDISIEREMSNSDEEDEEDDDINSSDIDQWDPATKGNTSSCGYIRSLCSALCARGPNWQGFQ